MIQLADLIARVRENLGDEAVTSDIILTFTDDGGIIGSLQKASDYISSIQPDVRQSLVTINEAPDDDYYVDAEDISAWTGGETATLTGDDPDVARNVKITITDADLSITAFTITVEGKDPRGTSQTETFSWNDGLVQEGEMLFSSLPSVTGTTISGAGSDDVLDVGFGSRCYNGISLPESGITTILDITTCRDIYGRAYFDDAVELYRVEYEVSTDSTGARNWHNVIQRGNEIEILYDNEIEADESMRIEWGKKHTLTFDSVTIPERFKELLIEGATGHALKTIGEIYTNKITDGVSVGVQWRTSGMMQVQQFKQGVKSRVPTRARETYSRS